MGRRIYENIIITKISRENNILSKKAKRKVREILDKVIGFEPVRLHELLTKQYGVDKYRLERFENKLYVEIPISIDISNLDFLVAYEHERIIPIKEKLQKPKVKSTVTKESQPISSNDKNYINVNKSIIVNEKSAKTVENENKTINPVREPPAILSLRATLTPTNSVVNLGSKKPMKLKRTINLIHRDTNLVKEMKKLYNNTCQVCGLKVQITSY